MEEDLPEVVAADPERAAEGDGGLCGGIASRVCQRRADMGHPDGAVCDEGDVRCDEASGEVGHLDALRRLGGEAIEDLRFGEDAAGRAVFDEFVGEERGDRGAVAAEGRLEELLFENA